MVITPAGKLVNNPYSSCSNEQEHHQDFMAIAGHALLLPLFSLLI